MFHKTTVILRSKNRAFIFHDDNYRAVYVGFIKYKNYDECRMGEIF